VRCHAALTSRMELAANIHRFLTELFPQVRYPVPAGVSRRMIAHSQPLCATGDMR